MNYLRPSDEIATYTHTTAISLTRHRINAASLTKIRIINVLVDLIALAFVEHRCITAWQSFIQHLTHSQQHLGTRLLLLAPVKHQLLTLQRLQQSARNLLDLILFPLGKFHVRPGEQVKDRQFLLRQLLGNVTLLLRVQLLREGHQLVKQELHVGTARVVFVDQPLEPLQVIGAALIQLHHALELAINRSPQLLSLDMLTRPLKMGSESVKVDLAQVDSPIKSICPARLANNIALR